MLTIGSLFAGIGGLDLGLEWAGLGPVIFQVEQSDFCRLVLAKHWPNADRSVTDVRTANASNLRHVDLICGGFPCQDVSGAGNGAGLAGTRSGLWFEFARIVEELRPRFVVVENVRSGAQKYLNTVLEFFASAGYRARAFALSAADVGAPHLRERVFVVADANVRMGERVAVQPKHEAAICLTRSGQCAASPWVNADRARRRVDDGLPRELDRNARVKALGNAVVPQCAEVVGRIIQQMLRGGR